MKWIRNYKITNQTFTSALKQIKELKLTELQNKTELLWTIFFLTSSEMNLSNIAEYKYFKLILMSLITEIKLTEIIMCIERNEYSCYTMSSSEISKLCCLWACLDWESYRRSRKNVDCSQCKQSLHSVSDTSFILLHRSS